MTAEARRSADDTHDALPFGPAVWIRNKALAALTFMAAVVFLQWAQEVFIPITLAVLLSYALTPIVEWLHKRLRVHKAIGAGALLLGIMGACVFGIGALQPQALNLVEIIPRAAEKLTAEFRPTARARNGALAKIEKAANEIDRVANAAGAPAAASPPPPDAPPFRIRDYILVGTVGLVSGLAELVVVVALVFFLLLAGDTFRRTLLNTSDDPLARKKQTLEMLDEIDRQIQRYLLVQIGSSALLGIVAWVLFATIGLDNALAWACIGGVLHLIPYAGPVGFVAIMALITYVQFDSLQPILETVGVLTVVIGVIGLFIVPWLTDKTGSVNAVTVFVALLVWGWLWGVWGLLLGVPIVMAIKTVCDNVVEWRPFAAFLGHAATRHERLHAAGEQPSPHT
jgi:predicted PurR-regulated permease PerM